MLKIVIVLLIVLMGLAGCRSTDPDILPTLAEPEAISTSLALTRNAPPTGFDTVQFPRIDDNLNQLAGWRYEMTFAFNGVYSSTPRETATNTMATVYFNQVGSSRRVQTIVDDDLQENSDPINYEGVRLGPDTYLVRDGTCLQASPESASVVADLNAGDVLGGVRQAVTAAQVATLNGQQVWRYQFLLDDVSLPNVRFGDNSVVRDFRGELWVSPQYNAVVRYYLTLEVDNVVLFDNALPVSGTIIIRYDLYDIGVVPAINIPYGC